MLTLKKLIKSPADLKKCVHFCSGKRSDPKNEDVPTKPYLPPKLLRRRKSISPTIRVMEMLTEDATEKVDKSRATSEEEILPSIRTKQSDKTQRLPGSGKPKMSSVSDRIHEMMNEMKESPKTKPHRKNSLKDGNN